MTGRQEGGRSGLGTARFFTNITGVATQYRLRLLSSQAQPASVLESFKPTLTQVLGETVG